MNTYGKFRGIKNDIRESGGFTVASMKELRDAAGYSRLGCNVILEIQDELRSHSIRWYPRLRADQGEMVWLYLPSSPMQKILRYVDRPSVTSFKRLRRMIT